jgi:hypothetical protein
LFARLQKSAFNYSKNSSCLGFLTNQLAAHEITKQEKNKVTELLLLKSPSKKKLR